MLFLAAAGSAGSAALTVVDFAVTGLAPESGASTAFSAVALVVSAASSTLSSALAATLLALAAVFCATEVASLEASTTVSAVSSRTSSRVSSTASTARSARRTTWRKAGWRRRSSTTSAPCSASFSTVATAWVRAVSTRPATVLFSVSGRTASANCWAVVRALPAASVARVRASLTARSAWTWASPGRASALETNWPNTIFARSTARSPAPIAARSWVL